MKKLKRLLVLVLVFAFCLSGLTTYAKNATKKYTCTYEDYNGNTQTAFIVNLEARYAQSGDDGIDGYILWLRGSCTYSSPFDCEWVGQDTTAGRHELELEASYYGQSTNIFYSVTYIPWSGGFVMFNASTNGINL